MRRLRYTAWLALLAAAALARAQVPAPLKPAQVPWSSLSAAQQHMLSQFSSRWSTLPAGRQQALAKGSDRWLHMTPAQRASALRRFRRWQALPAPQRRLLRRRWEAFEALPPARRQTVLENFRKFESLPAARRRQLRAEWRSATPEQRRRMLEQARQRALARRAMRRSEGPHGFGKPSGQRRGFGRWGIPGGGSWPGSAGYSRGGLRGRR